MVIKYISISIFFLQLTMKDMAAILKNFTWRRRKYLPV